MSSLSPCSSQITIGNESNYYPMEVDHLLKQRNELQKLGTLIDDGELGFTEEFIKQSANSDAVGLALVAHVADKQIKVLIVGNNQEIFFSLNQVYNHFKPTISQIASPELVTLTHLFLYLSKQIQVKPSQVKLYHLGKPYILNNHTHTENVYLLDDMKIDKFPSIHLVITPKCDYKRSIKNALIKCSTLTKAQQGVVNVDPVTRRSTNPKISKLKKLFSISVCE